MGGEETVAGWKENMRNGAVEAKATIATTEVILHAATTILGRIAEEKVAAKPPLKGGG